MAWVLFVVVTCVGGRDGIRMRGKYAHVNRVCVISVRQQHGSNSSSSDPACSSLEPRVGSTAGLQVGHFVVLASLVQFERVQREDRMG